MMENSKSTTLLRFIRKLDIEKNDTPKTGETGEGKVSQLPETLKHHWTQLMVGNGKL